MFFWGQVARCLSRHGGLGQLNNKNIFFLEIQKNALLTHAVIIAKQIIYNARRQNIRPCFKYFKIYRNEISIRKDILPERTTNWNNSGISGMQYGQTWLYKSRHDKSKAEKFKLAKTLDHPGPIMTDHRHPLSTILNTLFLLDHLFLSSQSL